jgi:Flp pilus assembly protein TadG
MSQPQHDQARADDARASRARPDEGPAEESERGSLTLMLAVLFVALIAMAGIVVDGGAKLDAAQNATAAAQEAARAGAGMVDRASAYTSGRFVVNQSEALAAARQYLTAAGYDDVVVSPSGPYSIRILVTVTKPTKVLSVIGIDTITATGTATATLYSGVTRGTR